MLLMVWSAAWLQARNELATSRQETIRNAANLAFVLEQSTERLLSDLDRIIRYIRANAHQHVGVPDWPTLVREDYTLDAQTAQISIIDARGMMIASSKDPYPATPLDLSDRSHYRAHLGNSGDFLFISRPMIGRVSKRHSVQLSRPYKDPSGGFGGVIVVSLDTERFSSAYKKLWVGRGSGFAIIGTDDIIRAGAGTYENAAGRSFRDEMRAKPLQYVDDKTEIAILGADDNMKPMAIRPIEGFPLSVVVSGREIGSDQVLAQNRMRYTFAACLVSIILIVAGMLAVRSQRKHERHLLLLARQDPLTNLANRTQVTETLDAWIAGTGSGAEFALLLVDLDGFKSINDKYGHAMGDRLLELVARRLRGKLRRGETAARLGGDEFAVLISNFENAEYVTKVAGRIVSLISEPYELGGAEISIGASVGIAYGRSHEGSTAKLLNAADIALYSAKRSGRGSYRVYNPEMLQAEEDKRKLLAELQAAVARREFVLNYQPIVSTKTLDIVSYEALIRWAHPTKGLLGPNEFIALAEESGLIRQIGKWVLGRAVTDIAAFSEHARVAVNCSPLQLKDEAFADDLGAAIARSGLNPDRLELEITESLLLERDPRVSRNLDAIKALGVSISLDDFGTGFSALSYLQNHPVDKIKIDRSFIARLEESSAAACIVQAVLTLAKGLGISTLAEGVETWSQVEELKRLGCHELQGFYFGKPQALEELKPSCTPMRALIEAA